MSETELFKRGLEIRKEVVGAEYVDKAIANADSFNMPMQELVTEYCWGAVWGARRPATQNTQHAQPRHDQYLKSSTRTQVTYQWRIAQWRDQRRDS